MRWIEMGQLLAGTAGLECISWVIVLFYDYDNPQYKSFTRRMITSMSTSDLRREGPTTGGAPLSW